jgi:hypothetical protein
MKNLFLFVAVATMAVFSSCSSDDDKKEDQPVASELKVTINGTQKTFNSIQVNRQESGYGDYYLNVTASINNSPNEVISFLVEEGAVGADALIPYNFTYTFNNKSYNSYNSIGGGSNLSSIIQTNNASTKKLAGTFTGTVYHNNNSTNTTESLNLTNGSFNISY